jgi:hypothetical protein
LYEAGHLFLESSLDSRADSKISKKALVYRVCDVDGLFLSRFKRDGVDISKSAELFFTYTVGSKCI